MDATGESIQPPEAAPERLILIHLVSSR